MISPLTHNTITTSHHTTLHFTTPHFTTSHHTSSYHTSPHRITLYHITPYHISPHHTSLHHTTPYHTSPHHITHHRIISHHITSHHITSHFTTLHHTSPHHVTSYFTTPHFIIPHHITPYHTTPHHISPLLPHHTIPPHHTTPHHISPHHTIPHHTSSRITLHHLSHFTISSQGPCWACIPQNHRWHLQVINLPHHSQPQMLGLLQVSEEEEEEEWKMQVEEEENWKPLVVIQHILSTHRTYTPSNTNTPFRHNPQYRLIIRCFRRFTMLTTDQHPYTREHHPLSLHLENGRIEQRYEWIGVCGRSSYVVVSSSAAVELEQSVFAAQFVRQSTASFVWVCAVGSE